MINHRSQNLIESDYDKSRYFTHFRGWIYSQVKSIFRYEICGNKKEFKLAFMIELDRSDNEILVIIGLAFLTFYLRFPKRFEGYENSEYGFKLFTFGSDLIFSWSWANNPNESSSKDPKWKRLYVVINDKVFGNRLRLSDDLMNWEDQWFSFRGKEYCMNKMTIEKSRSFRSRIPFSLFHTTNYYANFKISSPPQYSGKWGNDGTYGMGAHLENFTMPKDYWSNTVNRQLAEKLIEAHYIKHCLKNLKKGGRLSNDRELPADVSNYQFIGVKQ